MNLDSIDWPSLERLRTAFLDGTAGVQDYWLGERDLASYDQTFAQRIGWKWDYVLNELKRRGWSPPTGEVLDWGCGTGIAGRAFVEHFGADTISTLCLWDRSSRAMEFAARRVRERFPKLKVRTESPTGRTVGSILLSHVITELSKSQIEEILALTNEATCVLWVEPGTHVASRRLIEVREKLRERFRVVAPCTHQVACGMLAPENSRDWCHHFAPSPSQVFTDGNWARFARIAGVNLRSLPLSFIVLDKRPQPPLPQGATRVIGEPRVYKAHALILGCAESGVHERRLMKRNDPVEFRRLKKGDMDPLQLWKCEGDEIMEVRPLE
ncbi:MAG: hypothetical protein EXS18_03125 [Verrucomicrobiae bacterium]|nr:hypothetical protein [Verrucomicrobiae bacterium]